MTGARIIVCPHCLGARRTTEQDPDADGGRVMVPCEGCHGEGRMVRCEEPLCGEAIELSEAAREGAYCAACRHALDHEDVASMHASPRWA